MKTLNYNLHLLINNKYYLIYKILFILFIYLTIYNKDILLCMNENTSTIEAPEIAEAKDEIRPSHQVLALKNEIVAFAREHVSLSEQLTEQKDTIDTLTEELRSAQRKIYALDTELTEARNKIFNWEQKGMRHSNEVRSLKQKIFLLQENLNSRRNEAERYEALIERLNNRIRTEK